VWNKKLRTSGNTLAVWKLPFLAPGAGESSECFAVEDLLSHGENDALFFVKMFAASNDNAQQESAGLLYLSGFLDEGEMVLDLIMLVVKSFPVPDLLEAMFQWPNKQVIFGVGMSAQQSFDQGSEAFDFCKSFQFWGGRLDMIEHIMEDHMFGEQSVCDLHWMSIPAQEQTRFLSP
jgi:hypothetical protein